jgi:RimJ/RimL family protein N-acetyltransferase
MVVIKINNYELSGEDMRLETKRLLLRPWDESDAAVLYQIAKNPAVGPSAGWPVHKDEEDSRNIIRLVLSAENCFAIVWKETMQVIGAIELMNTERSNLETTEFEGEVGYWLGQEFWGRGFMPEALEEILRYAFEDKKLTDVWAGYFDGNEKSKRVLDKCGFRYQYTKEKMYWKLTDQYLTEHILLIKRNDWKQRIKRK